MTRSAHRWLAAGLVSAVLLVGCASEREVQDTEEVLEQLRRELADHPDVATVNTRMDTSTGTTAPNMLTVVAEANTEDEDTVLALIHDIARDTWNSEIPSISTLTIEVDTPGAAATYDSRQVFDELAIRRSTLEEEFGPRP